MEMVDLIPNPLSAIMLFCSNPPYRIYQPPSNLPHIPVTAASHLNNGPVLRSENPRLHWRPRLSTEELVQMGLEGFGIHYSSFSFAPSKWRIRTEDGEPLHLGIPVSITGNTSDAPGVIILQDVVDLTSSGDLLVYGWSLSPRQEITTYTRGFLVAVDFEIPPTSMVLLPLLSLICTLPITLAQCILRVRYR